MSTNGTYSINGINGVNGTNGVHDLKDNLGMTKDSIKTTNGTYSINGTNGVYDTKETNGTCLDGTRSENIFNRLKSQSTRKSYSTLYNYLKSVIQEVTPEQPFYVLDLADVLWKMQLWREKFPGITPFYAVKANPDPILVRLFCMLGFSFDCSTKGEIQLILENGGKPQNIIYAHTVKPHSSLQYASKVGVDFMTFDSEEELRKIKKYFPLARLVLRIKAESTQGFYDLNQKYGIQVSEAEKLLHRAKELEMNIIGVSFHVGALCKNPRCYTKTIENCSLIFDIAEKLGFNFTVLDLGAGFFGSYQREQYFDKVATEIKRALKEYFSEKNIRIIAEPGCFYVASAQRNVTCVLGRKAIQQNNSIVNGNNNDNESSEVERHYFINDGIYGSFFEHLDMYDVVLKPLVDPRELVKRPVYKSKIWGQTCCSEDVVLKSTPLPELDYEEYLVWENMGAYSQGLSSTFTGVPLPTERRVFIKNSRLNLDWVENLDELLEFLAKNVDLIENEGFP